VAGSFWAAFGCLCQQGNLAKIINNAPALSHWVELIYATFIHAHTHRGSKKVLQLGFVAPARLHCFWGCCCFSYRGCTAECAIFL